MDNIADICLRALSGLFSPYLFDQSLSRILISHAKTRPILHDDLSIRLRENKLDRSSQTFGDYDVMKYTWFYNRTNRNMKTRVRLTIHRELLKICLMYYSFPSLLSQYIISSNPSLQEAR